jgi:uncharacterized 2Fe-2S/4Fe-4S cluster protein (DUF4445 family)
MKIGIRQSRKNKTLNALLKIDFEPVGLRGLCQPGMSLLECARHLGVDLVNLCGGAGKCGRCTVQIIAGDATPMTEIEKNILSEEHIRRGYRLACETMPLSDLKVAVPPDSLTAPQRAQVESMESPAVPEPLIRLYPVELSQPGFADLSSDFRRLSNGLTEKYGIDNLSIDVDVLSELPARLRDGKRNICVGLRQQEIIALTGPDTKPMGIAVDLGTTKIAVYLVDLENGRVLASKGMMNPQIKYGEDIISRFMYAQASPDQAGRLWKIVIDTLNQMISGLCTDSGVLTENIFEVVIVCNTAMHHLFLGLPTESLSRAPYIPVIDSDLDVKAGKFGLKTAKGAYVHFLPNIAGYVGSDHVAMLLAVGILQKNGVVLTLDIGTNTEICLSDNGRMSSLSCASGPAFEGAHVKFGMRAANGAIERLRIEDNLTTYQTIGSSPARGFCGSGILDAVAELYKAGALEKNGRMVAGHPLIRNMNGQKEFVITVKDRDEIQSSEITFSQKDLREIQLAKGAIRTGIEALLKVSNLVKEEIDQIIIAGAFGSYINMESAIRIGMLPNISTDRIIQVGNAAGLGSRLALVSITKRKEAVQIASKVEYIELAAFPDFSTIFVEAMHLG